MWKFSFLMLKFKLNRIFLENLSKFKYKKHSFFCFLFYRTIKDLKIRNMSKNALKLFDQSNLNNCNYIIKYAIINNIFL